MTPRVALGGGLNLSYPLGMSESVREPVGGIPDDMVFASGFDDSTGTAEAARTDGGIWTVDGSFENLQVVSAAGLEQSGFCGHVHLHTCPDRYTQIELTARTL